MPRSLHNSNLSTPQNGSLTSQLRELCIDPFLAPVGRCYHAPTVKHFGATSPGYELLKAAIVNRDLRRLVRYLNSRNVKAGARDPLNGATAGHLAAVEGLTEYLQVLLDAGLDPDACDYSGRTLTHCASRRGHTECLSILDAARKRRVPPARTHFELLAATVIDRDLRKLKWYLSSKHIKPTDRDPVTGVTAGHLAAADGLSEHLKAMLDAGLDPDDCDAAGNTLAHYAAKGGHTDCISVLASALADFSISNLQGINAVQEAKAAGMHECAVSAERLAQECYQATVSALFESETTRLDRDYKAQKILLGRQIPLVLKSADIKSIRHVSLGPEDRAKLAIQHQSYHVAQSAILTGSWSVALGQVKDDFIVQE